MVWFVFGMEITISRAKDGIPVLPSLVASVFAGSSLLAYGHVKVFYCITLG